jgi:putative ABC transport system substrate-binding protein
LLAPNDSTVEANRDLVIALAARHRLPAVYAFRDFVTAGGLMYYGTDLIAQFRRAASYIERRRVSLCPRRCSHRPTS